MEDEKLIGLILLGLTLLFGIWWLIDPNGGIYLDFSFLFDNQ